jgi:hypothetical protein
MGKDNAPAPKIEEQLSSMFIDDDWYRQDN